MAPTRTCHLWKEDYLTKTCRACGIVAPVDRSMVKRYKLPGDTEWRKVDGKLPVCTRSKEPPRGTA